MPDYVTDENHVHNDFLPDGYSSDTFKPRCSQDKGHIINNRLLLLDLCKQTGLSMFNGRFANDCPGKFTFVGRSGSSLVDYILSTTNSLSCVDDFYFYEPNIMSDHCIVSL